MWEGPIVHTDMRASQTLKVCKLMAFMAIIMGLGLLFYILLGFRIWLGMLQVLSDPKSRILWELWEPGMLIKVTQDFQHYPKALGLS